MRAYLNITSQQPVEQIHIRIPEDRQILVLLDRRLASVQLCHTSLLLQLKRLYSWWYQTVGLEVLSFFDRMCGVVIGSVHAY